MTKSKQDRTTVRQALVSTRSVRRVRSATAFALAAGVLVLTACGGSSNDTSAPPAVNGTISGTAVKGPVNGGSMAAFAITNGAKGAQLGNATTDAQGHFTMSVGDYSGGVMLQMTGGTYTDEASNATMTMGAGDVMTAVMPTIMAGSNTTGVVVTPLTSMAQARAQAMNGGMTDANIAAANGAVGSYFMVGDILHTTPMNPLVAGSGTGATQDMKNHGMAIAAMSEYARTIGMTSSSGIVTAMMNDGSDGVMNGMMGSSPVSMTGMGGMMGGNMQPTGGTTSLAGAMSQFMGSTLNKSGVPMADMQPLIDRLNGSNGQLAAGVPAAGLSGTAFMGAMTGGSMTAFAVSNGAKGAQLGATTTDAQGRFTMPTANYSGPVLLEMSGGTYMDEATGTTMAMQSNVVMTAVLPTSATTATTPVVVTPLTSMAQARAQSMGGGMTDANIATANAAVGSYFMVGDIVHTMPMDPIVAGSATGATQDSKHYGMAIAGMSQYAKTIGMTTSSSGIVTAMMDDASDGVMNGMMGSAPISMTGTGGMMGGNMQPTGGTASLADAMSQFMGSTMNRSGVPSADMQPLVDKLKASSGALQ